MKRQQIIQRAIFLAIIFYLFLLSIKLMEGSFKLFGKGLAEQLVTFTTNPVVALFIGILATTVMQSSSASTSLIVGLVASNALTINAAIFMIMGANIGTSVTNTIVSLAHITRKEEFKRAFEVATIHDFFNLMVVAVLFPLEYFFGILEKSATYLSNLFLGGSVGISFQSPLDYLLKPVAASVLAFFANPMITLTIAVLMLFLSLRYFVKIIRPFTESEFKHLLHKHIFSSPIRSFTFGVLLTIMAQSSSVTTSLVVPLAGVGIITLRRMFPYILGANIGTTFTALLAALVTGSAAAVTIALAHLLFNLYGVLFIYPIREIPLRLSEKMAHISFKWRAIPFTYIGVFFYAIPFLIVVFLH